MVQEKKVIVISLGGSIIVPGKVDYGFLKSFKDVMEKFRKKAKIVICTGGGSTARGYIRALEMEGIGTLERDIIGIAATRLNAKLVASFLGGCNDEIPTSIRGVKPLLGKYSIVVCGGLKPGRTSDGSTAEIAEAVGAESFVNITNVDGLFDKDPRKYADAKLIPIISHSKFKDIMDKLEEKPGQHFIMDSTAAKIARDAGIKIVILKGTENLENYLSGKKFTGTIIS